jgi:hypothetical protein
VSDETKKFEQLLKRQSLRQAPAEWRKEILAAANEVLPAQSSRPAAAHSFLAILRQRLSSLLWPHPVAWGGLAAIWIFIFAVNFSTRDRAPEMAEKTSPPSPEVTAELRQQQRLYAELIGITSSADSTDADRPKTFAPRPRSERTDILTA